MKNQRYSISGLTILDSGSDPEREIHIRELLDMPSEEFQRCKWLDARKRMDIIEALGLEALIQVLDECYRQGGKNYNATQEAECTMQVLEKMAKRKVVDINQKTQPVIQFVQQYFEERAAFEAADDERRAAFREHWYTTDYLACKNQEVDRLRNDSKQYPATVLELTMTDEEARVGISGPWGETEYGATYLLLRKTSVGWKINMRGAKCNRCAGTGRDPHMGKLCSQCNGDGWHEYQEYQGGFI